MKIILAEKAGFCFGVERAVDMAMKEAAAAPGKVWSWGPVIHNEEVVREFEEAGGTTLEEGDPVPACGTVVLRSHGVGPEVYQQLEAAGLRIVDATCPFVLRIHRIARETAEAGGFLLVAGDPSHAEVKGILGWAGEYCAAIGSPEDVESLVLPAERPVTLVAQTTFPVKKFQDIVEKLKHCGYSINVVNTICNATRERQEEAQRVAACVDAMVVIGGTRSSNSQKLFEICRSACPRTCFIQTYQDLTTDDIIGAHSIGITAGASTPKKIIQEVLHTCQSYRTSSTSF